MKKKPRFLSLCSDTIFKAMYKNHQIGRDWINKLIKHICDVDVNDYTLIDNELNESKRSKDNVLDLVLKNEATKTVIDLEINNNYYYSLEYRNIYYVHRLAGLGIKEGDEYEKIFTIQINLNNYLNESINDGEFMYRMYDTKHKIYHKDETRIYSIYLPFYKDICYDGSNEKEMMFSMLSADSFDKLKEVANNNEEALKIIDYLEHIMNDDTIITKYEQEMINKKLDRSIKKEIARNAKNEGFAEGLAEGSKNEKINIAKKLLNTNMPINEIVNITGLTKEYLEKLKKE